MFLQNGLSIWCNVVWGNVFNYIYHIRKSVSWRNLLYRANTAIEFKQYSNNLPNRFASTENTTSRETVHVFKMFPRHYDILLEQVKEIILSRELLVARTGGASAGIGDVLDGLVLALVVVKRGWFILPPAAPLKHIAPEMIRKHISQEKTAQGSHGSGIHQWPCRFNRLGRL